MEIYDLVAQAIGLAAMTFNILSYQQKKDGAVIAFQLFGALLFSVNFFMIGGIIGGILNVVAAIRAVIFVNANRFHARHIFWQIGFFVVFVLSYIATFTVFKTSVTPFNLLIEVFPVIGLTATTVSFRFSDASVIRKFAFISSPAWLIYNVIHFSLGGIICEALSIVSVVIGMIRHDRKK